MILDLLLLAHVDAAIIMLLPLVGRSPRRLARHPQHEGVASLAPFLKTVEQAGLGVDRRHRGLDVVEQRALHRKEKTDRLAGVEMNPVVRPGKTPVHGEGERRPVGLDHAGQRIDRILRLVRRTADPQIPSWRRAEDAGDVEGEDALPEQRRCDIRDRPFRIRSDRDGAGVGLTVPEGLEGAGVQQFPAMRIGDVERQAAVGEGFRCCVHPVAPRRRRPDQRLPAGMKKAGQVHRMRGARETSGVIAMNSRFSPLAGQWQD